MGEIVGHALDTARRNETKPSAQISRNSKLSRIFGTETRKWRCAQSWRVLSRRSRGGELTTQSFLAVATLEQRKGGGAGGTRKGKKDELSVRALLRLPRGARTWGATLREEPLHFSETWREGSRVSYLNRESAISSAAHRANAKQALIALSPDFKCNFSRRYRRFHILRCVFKIYDPRELFKTF